MMKALKVTVQIIFIILSLALLVFSLTANLFVDDVFISTYAALNNGVNPGVGKLLLSIMADGYLTIVDMNILMVFVVVSLLVLYLSVYLLMSTLKGYPAKSIFTKNYWYQFDLGISYRPFVKK